MLHMAWRRAARSYGGVRLRQESRKLFMLLAISVRESGRSICGAELALSGWFAFIAPYNQCGAYQLRATFLYRSWISEPMAIITNGAKLLMSNVTFFIYQSSSSLSYTTSSLYSFLCNIVSVSPTLPSTPLMYSHVATKSL